MVSPMEILEMALTGPLRVDFAVELSFTSFSGPVAMMVSIKPSSDFVFAKFRVLRIPVGCFGKVTNAIPANDVQAIPTPKMRL